MPMKPTNLTVVRQGRPPESIPSPKPPHVIPPKGPTQLTPPYVRPVPPVRMPPTPPVPGPVVPPPPPNLKLLPVNQRKGLAFSGAYLPNSLYGPKFYGFVTNPGKPPNTYTINPPPAFDVPPPMDTNPSDISSVAPSILPSPVPASGTGSILGQYSGLFLIGGIIVAAYALFRHHRKR